MDCHRIRSISPRKYSIKLQEIRTEIIIHREDFERIKQRLDVNDF